MCPPDAHTERSMLKGECHNVLDSLNGIGLRVSRKAFADDKLDTAKIVRRAPVALLEQLMTEGRKG